MGGDNEIKKCVYDGMVKTEKEIHGKSELITKKIDVPQMPDKMEVKNNDYICKCKKL